MNNIGEFTINALNKMCAECPKPKLQLDCCSIETFEGGDSFSYRLYCENQDQCEYAIRSALSGENISAN